MITAEHLSEALGEAVEDGDWYDDSTLNSVIVDGHIDLEEAARLLNAATVSRETVLLACAKAAAVQMAVAEYMANCDGRDDTTQEAWEGWATLPGLGSIYGPSDELKALRAAILAIDPTWSWTER
ncbi:hypothetical protein NKH71_03340 [Mesorhizobium sp. M0983]|uniref:hypothetical protein n=1 Tax=Mesorhizobium sp. M0983 TaxID=2957040 RepID=UPI00333DFCB6